MRTVRRPILVYFSVSPLKGCLKTFSTLLMTPMLRRSLLSTRTRETFFGILSDFDDLTEYYVLSFADVELIRMRWRDENRFSMEVHLALLRYPEQGWREGVMLLIAFLDWLGDQLRLSP